MEIFLLENMFVEYRRSDYGQSSETKIFSIPLEGDGFFYQDEKTATTVGQTFFGCLIIIIGISITLRR